MDLEKAAKDRKARLQAMREMARGGEEVILNNYPRYILTLFEPPRKLQKSRN